MKSNGFTLIEMLMVIIVLAIIFTLLAPNLTMFTNRISESELAGQEEMVIRAANMYANDRRNRYYNGIVRPVNVGRLQELNYISGSIDIEPGRVVCIPATRTNESTGAINTPCFRGDGCTC